MLTVSEGDKDPLDVVEIGDAVGHIGQIKQVKPLGVLAMIDEGETDWKVIVIDVTDPHAAEMNGSLASLLSLFMRTHFFFFVISIF